MTKEGEEVPAQEEERRGGGSRRKEGRERGAGVPGSRLCSGPRCAEDAPRGTWDIAGLEVQRGARPQPGGVLRLRGFCTAYVLSGAFFSPRRLLFFVGAASPFAAARKIGKLPEEAPSAQPGLRSARLRGTAVLHVRRRLWPRGRPGGGAWAFHPGVGIHVASARGEEPRGLARDSPSFLAEHLGLCLSLLLENGSTGSETPAVTAPVTAPEDCRAPRGRPGTPVSIRRFPSWNGEWGSFAATSQRLR